MHLEFPVEQFDQAIDAVVDQLLTEARIDHPPVDAAMAARRLGVVVAAAGPTVERARLTRIGPLRQPVIYLGDEPRRERRHWAVAHELGEWAAHRVFQSLGIAGPDLTPAIRESTANRFAGRFLLPGRWFIPWGQACDWDLFELKQAFATASHELIVRRMLEGPRPLVVTLFDGQRRTWRASNVGCRTPPVTACEADVRRALARRRQPVQADPQALPQEFVDVRGWPVDEPSWRRDILCTELAELGWWG